MANGLGQIRPQGANSTKFRSKGSWRAPRHIGFKQQAFMGLQIVGCRSTKAFALDALGNQGTSPATGGMLPATPISEACKHIIWLSSSRSSPKGTAVRPALAALAIWLRFTPSRASSP